MVNVHLPFSVSSKHTIIINFCAIIINSEIDDFTSDGVISSGEVVSGIFLSGDKLLGWEKLCGCSSADLIDNRGLKIEEDGSGNVITGTSLGDEGVESVVTTSDGLIGRHLTVRLNLVLEAIKLPVDYVTNGVDSLPEVDENDPCVSLFLLN